MCACWVQPCLLQLLLQSTCQKVLCARGCTWPQCLSSETHVLSHAWQHGSQQGGPCPVLPLLLTAHHGFSRKELNKGTKSCGLHIPSTRLDKVKPKHLISHVLLLPQTCCWMNGPARLRKNKLSRTNKTRPGNLTLVFNPNTTLILIETTI